LVIAGALTWKFFALPEKNRIIKLYYYNPQLDKDETGNTKCSRDGLVAIERKIPLSKTPIQDTIKLLLKGKENLTEAEISAGNYNRVSLRRFFSKKRLIKRRISDP